MEVKLNPARFCLQVGLWAVVLGCNSSPHHLATGPTLPVYPDRPARLPQPGGQAMARSNGIIFIALSISQDQAANRRVVRMESLVKKPGQLKPRSLPAEPAGPFLTCSLLAGGQLVDSLHLEHPLFKNPEIANAQNHFSRRAITLEQAEFFVRLEQKGADTLVITEMLPGAPGQELIRISL